MSLFHTTQWSLVLGAADDQGRPALEALCRAYRPPVLAYIRHLGYSREDAEDLAQEFFLHFLEGDIARRADPQRGRFRSYLLTILRHSLATAHARAGAAKRGGQLQVRRLDDVDPAEVAASDERESRGPERAFELSWAITVLERATQALAEEARRDGKAELFAQLRPCLIEAPDEDDYRRLAQALGLRRNTLAVAVHRLRQRLRDKVRAELLDTLADPDLVEDELRHLRQSLSAM
ncbi:MAG: sigma-70 family RNA polymerase sigma factor [Lysobacteraceae bacterium]